MTDSDKPVGGILKKDARGRVRSTPQQRQAVLEEFERSGLSGPQFARVAGIAYQTFSTWRAQHQKSRALTLGPLRVAKADGKAKAVRLVEAVMRSPAPALPAPHALLKIDLPGGSSVVLNNATQALLAAQLIKAIASPC